MRLGFEGCRLVDLLACDFLPILSASNPLKKDLADGLGLMFCSAPYSTGVNALEPHMLFDRNCMCCSCSALSVSAPALQEPARKLVCASASSSQENTYRPPHAIEWNETVGETAVLMLLRRAGLTNVGSMLETVLRVLEPAKA